ncbi:hypothetical protein NST62_02210 [Ureibacillus sp. FSL K6-8385]|uniref:hypothetical protein n=1 Tax=Ureibacillus sp. FSL K6-8385 TaxID=2954684 RepID=UPI0031591AF8
MSAVVGKKGIITKMWRKFDEKIIKDCPKYDKNMIILHQFTNLQNKIQKMVYNKDVKSTSYQNRKGGI